MANSRSALKRVRKTKTETARNRAAKTRIKVARKSALSAVESGDAKAAQSAYNVFASEADKAAKKGVVHKKTASRLKSRLAAKIAAISA
ncbi:MAG: 30S ribosomal protein S20 [Verrucomicrobiales bacterium]|nr:30S ribosomal protein S20 [Verrucomicrobiales bacterium]